MLEKPGKTAATTAACGRRRLFGTQKTLPARKWPGDPAVHRARPAPRMVLAPWRHCRAPSPSVFPPVAGHDKEGQVRCISGGKVRAGRL